MTIKINGTNTTAQPSITGTDTDTGLVYGTNEVSIVTGGTERVKIDTNGLKFNGDTAAANALDDYEEGVWSLTPTGGTWNVSRAFYVKIGRKVTIHFSGSITNATNADVSFTLPFIADTSTSAGTGVGIESHGNCMINLGTPPSNIYNAAAYCYGSLAYIYYSRVGAAWVKAVGAYIGSNLQFTATYTSAP